MDGSDHRPGPHTPAPQSVPAPPMPAGTPVGIAARLNVAAKIWLAIGIFVLGFVFCTALTSIQGRNTEQRLENTSEALFPAALRSQEAEAAFGRTVQGFSDAVVMQDAAALAKAAADG